MATEALGSLGSKKANRSAFKQHALVDDGVLWLSESPLQRLLFSIPMDVMQQSWLGTTEQSERFGGFQVTAGYTKAHFPNGACSIEQGEHCISLTQGLVFHLLRICAAAARYAPAFSDLPDEGSLPVTSYTENDWLRWDQAADKKLFNSLSSSNVLHAPFRQRLAFLLLFDSLLIAWFHEAFHVYLGHCGYMKDRRHRLRMTEQNSSVEESQPETRDYLSQAFEFEADHTSIRMVTDLVYKQADPIYHTLTPEINSDQRLGILLIAGCLLTLGWSALEKQFGRKNQSHPPASIRYYTMILGHSDRSETYTHTEKILQIQRWAYEQFTVLEGANVFFQPLGRLGEQTFQEEANRKTQELQSILKSNASDLESYRYK